MRHVYIGVILLAHSVRGEPRTQRNASGEVAKKESNEISVLLESD